ESGVEDALRQLLGGEQPISAAAVEEALTSAGARLPWSEVTIESVDLRCFDELLTDKEVGHDSGGGERDAGGAVARVAFAELPVELRGAGPTGRAGDVELRALSAGAVRARMPGTSAAAHRASAGAIPAAAGEELRDVRPEATAGQGGPTGAEPAHRRLRG